MKAFLKNFAILAVALGTSSSAYAVTCVDTTCQVPGTVSVTAHTITTISLSANNSGTGTPNPTNSIYIMEATTAGSPSTVPDSVNGTVVIIGIQYFGSGVTGDVISGIVQPTVGGTSYNIFVKACPAGTDQNNGLCSAWVSGGSVLTTSYPGNPGFLNVAAADTAPRQFTSRTSGVQDSGNVLAWQLMVNNSDVDLGAGSSAFLTQQPFSGAATGAGAFTITSAQYASLLPNLGYTATEHLIYFYNKTGPNTTIAKFFTQPVNPVAINPATGVTHCSATLTFQNTTANPANPADSTYSVNVGGPVSSGSAIQTALIGGTGIFSDQNSVTYTNLQAGTNYSPNVTALNRGGGAWLNSSAMAYTPFNTVAWGGTFVVNNINTTTADFVASGVNTAGVTSWQIQTVPAVAGLPTGDATNLNGTHTMTGLTPNTQYTVQIKITEASGCFSVLPIAAISFTTDAAVPTTFALSATSPTQLHATWADGVNNAATTAYQVQYCLDAGFTTGCNTQNVGINVLTANLAAIPETTYFAHVKALAAPGGTDSAFSNSASATTPNQAPTLNNPVVVVHITSATLSATALDNAGPNALTFLWTVNPSGTGNPTLTSTTGNITISGSGPSGTATSVTQLTFTMNQTYSGTVTVTDHNGTGLSTVKNWSTSAASQVPTSISVSPLAPTVITGNGQLFTATVLDQFGQVIAGQAVNWSVSGGGSLTTANGASTTFNATTPNAPNPPYTLTASFPGATSGTASITVLAAGPQVNSLSFAMAPGNKGGTLTLVGHDNVVHSVTSNYSASPAGVVFTPTSTTSADNVPATTAVTFPSAGTFTLTTNLGSGVSSSTVVNVPQILSGLKVCAAGDTTCAGAITIKTLQNQQFTATGADQFGNSMPLGSIVWSNNVSASGASASFSSPSLGQNIRITATDQVSGKSGFIIVNVVSFDVSGAKAFPVPYKASAGNPVIHFDGLGSQATIHIYTTSGRRVFDVSVTAPTYDWNIKNSSGESIASGVYFFVIESPEGKKNGKLIIIQ